MMQNNREESCKKRTTRIKSVMQEISEKARVQKQRSIKDLELFQMQWNSLNSFKSVLFKYQMLG
jgi:hypothetical protein